MRAGLPFILGVGMVMTLCGECAEAQAPATSREPGHRIEWTAGPTRGPCQRVCESPMYSDTSPRRRTYSCSTAQAGAARCSVTLLGAQWETYGRHSCANFFEVPVLEAMIALLTIACSICSLT